MPEAEIAHAIWRQCIRCAGFVVLLPNRLQACKVIPSADMLTMLITGAAPSMAPAPSTSGLRSPSCRSGAQSDGGTLASAALYLGRLGGGPHLCRYVHGGPGVHPNMTVATSWKTSAWVGKAGTGPVQRYWDDPCMCRPVAGRRKGWRWAPCGAHCCYAMSGRACSTWCLRTAG